MKGSMNIVKGLRSFVAMKLKRANWHALEQRVSVAKLAKSMQGLTEKVSAALANPAAAASGVTPGALERLEKKYKHTFLGALSVGLRVHLGH